MWRKIAEAVNAIGVAMRTTAEVREKWRNLQSQAKKEFSELSKEQKKTGGGPAPKMPSALTAEVIDIFKETPSFTGLEGFESTGPEANLPTEAAEQVPTTVEVNNSLFEQLQEAVQDGPKPQEVKVVNVQKAENQSKKNRRKITQEDILEEHYKALIAKQENLKLKKRKLELEVFQQKVSSVPGYQVSINLSP